MQPAGDALLHVELLFIREHLLLIVDDDLAQVSRLGSPIAIEWPRQLIEVHVEGLQVKVGRRIPALLNVVSISRIQEPYVRDLDVVKGVSKDGGDILLWGVDRYTHQDVFLHVKLLYVHDHLLVVQLLITEVDLALIDVKPELLLDAHLLDVLDLGVLRDKERVEAPLGGCLLMCGLFLIHLGVESVQEKYADQDILWV